MKKVSIRSLLIVFVLILCFSTPANAAKIKLNKKSLTLTVGKTYKLKVKGTKKKVKWSSSNKKVATVSKKGKVKAKKAGKAIISVKAGKKKLSCKIIVKKKKSNAKGVKPQFSKSLITLNLYTHSSDSVRLKNISASQMKKVKVWIEKTTDVYVSGEMSISQKVSYSISGNTITIKAKNPGDFYLYASYGKKTGRCRIVIDGFDEFNDLFCNGKNYYFGDDGSCSQTKYGDLLCKAYPETYGVFRKQYISKCKTPLAKILCINKFYNDFGYQYKVTNFNKMHYFTTSRIGQCQDYADETYNLCCVAGIPVEVVQSNKLNHAWNQVYIEGSWHPVDTVCNDLSFWALSTQYKKEIPNDSNTCRGEWVTGNKNVSRKGYVLKISGKNVDLSKCVISFSLDDLMLQIFPKNDHKEQLKDILVGNSIFYDLKSHFVN